MDRMSLMVKGHEIWLEASKAKTGTLSPDSSTATKDKGGFAKIPIKADGQWMFLVRHRDPSKGVPDQFDEAVFVTTLTLEVAKN